MILRQPLIDVLDAAAGRVRRDDPVLPHTGGPAGNARLTAWLGLVLLLLSVAELATLLSIHQLISWHIVIGVLLVPTALAKTASTGWRIFRFYIGAPAYRQAGPPPLLLRLLGPLVVLTTLAVLGSGLALIALGPNATFGPWLTVVGHQINPLTVHQACFLAWGVTTGLHVVARTVPAARLVTVARQSGGHVAGGPPRALTVLTALVVSALAAAVVLGLSSPWSTVAFHRLDRPSGAER